MVFSGIPFLNYFLPCAILLYLLSPRPLKNTALLVSSLVFYAWGEPLYLYLIVSVIAINYVLALLIERYRGGVMAKVFMLLSVAVCLCTLGYFKYADFFVENFNRITGLSVGLLNVSLPIGISFYTFQVLSYIIDVYRGDVAAQKNPVNLATYVALFPQLIAGPIVRYADIERQLVKRTHSFLQIADGIRRFVIGLSKKVLIANTLGELCEAFYISDEKSVAFYWLYIVAYMLQVYFDFSGYSDMAIGLGKLFGFEFLENFNYPFIAKSVTEFWRRWHISLGSWFRDYVYIPMGGNRVGAVRMLFNIFTVWFLTGFWHGAEWNFVVWGIYFGVLLTIEKLFLGKYIKRSAAIGHIYTVIVISVSFAIFGAGSMSDAWESVVCMFGAGGLPFVTGATVYNSKSFAVVLIVAAVAATPLPKLLLQKMLKNNVFKKAWDVLEIVVLVSMVVLTTAYLVDGSFNPFLYFRF